MIACHAPVLQGAWGRAAPRRTHCVCVYRYVCLDLPWCVCNIGAQNSSS